MHHYYIDTEQCLINTLLSVKLYLHISQNALLFECIVELPHMTEFVSDRDMLVAYFHFQTNRLHQVRT